jgi:HPt (histidine-containing phosphotransfer) domain-containing protein
MDAYVTKPVAVELLGAALARLVDSSPDEEVDDVLDWSTVDSLWELGGNSPAVFEELAGLFVEGAPADIAALHGAVAEGGTAGVDFDVAAAAAHRLRGSCTAVGAVRMGRVAAEIEAAAMDHQADGLAANVARVEQSFEDVRGALRAATAATASPAGGR